MPNKKDDKVVTQFMRMLRDEEFSSTVLKNVTPGLLEAGVELNFDKQKLLKFGIKVCELCSYMQPVEILICKNCNNLILYERTEKGKDGSSGFDDTVG